MDPLDNRLLVLTLASQKTWNSSSKIITTCNFKNDLHDICSKQKSQKTAYTYIHTHVQTPADSEQRTELHNGHSRSHSFIAGNEAPVQQQQQQNAPRERCMLVHHSNIEIDSNDSLFFLRKNRESKTMFSIVSRAVQLTFFLVYIICISFLHFFSIISRSMTAGESYIH